RGTALFVDLEELKKRCSTPYLTALRGEEFPQVFGLLGRTPMVKREQDRIEQGRIDSLDIPAGIKVIGYLLCRHEAPLDVYHAAASEAQRVQCSLQAHQQPPPVRSGAKAANKVFPGRRMHARRQVSIGVKRRCHEHTYNAV